MLFVDGPWPEAPYLLLTRKRGGPKCAACRAGIGPGMPVVGRSSSGG